MELPPPSLLATPTFPSSRRKCRGGSCQQWQVGVPCRCWQRCRSHCGFHFASPGQDHLNKPSRPPPNVASLLRATAPKRLSGSWAERGDGSIPTFSPTAAWSLWGIFPWRRYAAPGGGRGDWTLRSITSLFPWFTLFTAIAQRSHAVRGEGGGNSRMLCGFFGQLPWRGWAMGGERG